MTTSTRNYGFIRSIDELADLVGKIAKVPDKPLAIDLETGYEGPPRADGSLAWHADAFIVGISFTIETRWARYVPLRHDLLDENLDPDKVWEILQPVLEKHFIVAHNLPFEKRGLRTVGIEINRGACTQVQAFVLSLWEKVGLKALVLQLFGHKMRELYELFPGAKSGDKKLRFNTLSLTPDVVAYACEDSSWGLGLYEYAQPRIAASKSLKFIYDVEMEVLHNMCDVTDYGVAVDWDLMQRWYERSIEFVAAYEDEVRDTFGELLGRSVGTLNVKSPPQLRKILFDPAPEGLGIPVVHTTEKGVASTDEISLTTVSKQLAHTKDESCRAKKHENCEPTPQANAVQKLLTARAVDMERKRFATWLDVDKRKYPTRGRDGRVHANYNQTRVPTGRFAATGPAIQQLPKDSKYELSDGKKFEVAFRDLIVATPGTYLIGFDYSQIELRAIAGLAKERSLLEAFEKGEDVHTLTAAMMLGKKVADVDPKKDRPFGKTFNFALIYQMGHESLADRLGISNDEAKRLFDSYFANMPAITAWVEHAKEDAKRRRPPATISHFGRQAVLWFLARETVTRRQFATGERQAVNFPVQGWAADYMKLAMVRVFRKLRKLDWWMSKVWLLMNQHDALVFEVSQEIAPSDFIRMMKTAIEFEVEGFPEIVAEWEFGYRYGSMKKCDAEGALSDAGEHVGDFVFEEERWHLTGQAGEIERDDIYEADVESDVVVLTVPDEPDVPEEHRPVVISVDRTPTANEFHSLMKFVSSTYGPYDVSLKTPTGAVSLYSGTAVNASSSADIAAILPGSAVYHPEERDIDVSLVAEALK